MMIHRPLLSPAWHPIQLQHLHTWSR